MGPGYQGVPAGKTNELDVGSFCGWVGGTLFLGTGARALTSTRQAVLANSTPPSPILPIPSRVVLGLPVGYLFSNGRSPPAPRDAGDCGLLCLPQLSPLAEPGVQGSRRLCLASASYDRDNRQDVSRP